MDDQHYLDYVKEGLWPGPLETQEAFSRRVAHVALCATLRDKDTAIDDITDALYGFKMSYLEATFSHQGLHFFEGAALWIEENEGIRYPRLQLRKAFLQGSFLFCSRDEVLSHERLHAARLYFDEPKYEEIIAYRSSKSAIRRYLGPLLSSTLDGLIFITLWILGFAIDLISVLAFGELYYAVLLLPLPWIAFLMQSLVRRQRRFYKALKQIGSLLREPGKALQIIAKLKDREIDALARCSTHPIACIEKWAPMDFRLRLLKKELSELSS